MRTEQEQQLGQREPFRIEARRASAPSVGGSGLGPFQVKEGRPPLWSELFAGFEWFALKTSPVYYGVGVPRGDGAPVVLVPGFLGSDLSLIEMHLWLGRLGYRSYPSGIGWNADCPDVLLERLEQTIARVHRETGRKVHLIGYSLGGLLARAAAARRPQHVAQLVTMGTPFHRLSAHPFVQGLVRKVLRRSRRENRGSCVRRFFAALRECTAESTARAAICSKGDAVVDWQDCSGVKGALNIEVRSTHIGMPTSSEVYRQLAQVLASPEGAQRPAWVEPRPAADLPLAA